MSPPTDDAVEHDLAEYLEVVIPLIDGGFIDPDEWASDDDPEVAPAPNIEVADRLLYKARRLAEERASYEALAVKRKAEIDAWLADRTHGIDRQMRWLSTSLESFARMTVERGGKKAAKTIVLPNGRLALKAPGRGKIVVTDEVAFTTWARRVGLAETLIRYEPKVAKAVLADEDLIGRREATQITDDRGDLVQSYQLTVDVTPDGKTGEIETAVIPGVLYVHGLRDNFTLTLTTDNPDQEEA